MIGEIGLDSGCEISNDLDLDSTAEDDLKDWV